MKSVSDQAGNQFVQQQQHDLDSLAFTLKQLSQCADESASSISSGGYSAGSQTFEQLRSYMNAAWQVLQTVDTQQQALRILGIEPNEGSFQNQQGTVKSGSSGSTYSSDGESSSSS